MTQRIIIIASVLACLVLVPLIGTNESAAQSPNGPPEVCADAMRSKKLAFKPFADGRKWVPVLLVHGITSSRDEWSKNLLGSKSSSVESMLADIPGAAVFTFDYSKHSLDWVADATIGPRLVATINCLTQAASAKAVVVAHSMGGLATQWAQGQTVNGGRVSDMIEEVVTLGTPTFGSQLSALGTVGQYTSPAAWAIVKACGLAGEHNPKSGSPNCSVISSLDTRAGRAMRPGSPELAALPRFAPNVRVHRFAGDVTLTWELLGAEKTFHFGDVVVALGSAIAQGTDQAMVDNSCDGSLVVFWLATCYHGNLPQSSVVAADVTKHVRAALERISPGCPTDIAASDLVHREAIGPGYRDFDARGMKCNSGWAVGTLVTHTETDGIVAFRFQGGRWTYFYAAMLGTRVFCDTLWEGGAPQSAVTGICDLPDPARIPRTPDQAARILTDVLNRQGQHDGTSLRVVENGLRDLPFEFSDYFGEPVWSYRWSVLECTERPYPNGPDAECTIQGTRGGSPVDVTVVLEKRTTVGGWWAISGAYLKLGDG